MNTPQETRALEVIQADIDAAAAADDGAIATARALSARDCGALQSEMRQARKAYLAEAFAAHRLTFSNVAHPQGDREAIARIIDPNAWVRRAHFQSIIAGTSPRKPTNPEEAAMYLRSATNRVDREVAPSLAKADAILALSPAPDGDYVLEPMPACDDREPYGIADYEESDDEWCSRNPEMVTWLIDNHAAIRAKLDARPSTPTPDNIGALRKAHLQIGDEVQIVPGEAGAEWRGEPPHYIAGIDWHGKYGVTYTTSETWPPKWDGLRAQGLTDEWLERQLRLRAALSTTPSPDAGGRAE